MLVDMVICMFCCVFLVYVDDMVISSAYEVNSSGANDCGMSDVYMLEAGGERTPP